MALAMAACTEDLSVAPELVNGTDQSPENAVSFSTYLGRSKTTRSGYSGAIDSEVLKEAKFGVFAYYTGPTTYNETNYGTGTKQAPNFMYNQAIEWDNTTSLWYYNPLKYWPNEVVGTTSPVKGVDDQENDTDNDPATTTYENGGNVSFFAYAPWVAVTNQGEPTQETGATPESVVDGIVALSGNQYAGDPLLTYIIPSTGKTIDLLWGTRGATTKNVNEEGNVGVTGDGGTGSTYANAILMNGTQGYTTNADLTKQTTTGKIDFLFKHALSKVGGSHNGEDGAGADEDATTLTNGLMIVLDLDNDGEETGGVLQSASKVAGLENAQTPYQTKVTVSSISIESDSQLKKDNSGLFSDESGYSGTTNETTSLTNKGRFNLATGRWSDYEAAGTNAISHIITNDASKVLSESNPTGTASALLSNVIAEPTTTTTGRTFFRETLPIGVTTVPKNVYEGTETNPLVFLPGTRPVLQVTVEYIVRTYDENLANSFSEVKQKIKKKLIFSKATELNKQYNILIHLGLTGVKFTATVSDWESTNASVTQQTDPATGEGIEVYVVDADDDVYNPINVEDHVQELKLEEDVPSGGTAIADKMSSKGSTTFQLKALATAKKNEENTPRTDIDVTENASYELSASWLHVTASGVVSADVNNSEAPRTATITAKYGDAESTSLTVTQYGRKLKTVFMAKKPTTGKKPTTAKAPGTTDVATIGQIGGSFTYPDTYGIYAEYVDYDGSSEVADDTENNYTDWADVTKLATLATDATTDYHHIKGLTVTYDKNDWVGSDGTQRKTTFYAKFGGVNTNETFELKQTNSTMTLEVSGVPDILPAEGMTITPTVKLVYNKGVTGQEWTEDITEPATTKIVKITDDTYTWKSTTDDVNKTISGDGKSVLIKPNVDETKGITTARSGQLVFGFKYKKVSSNVMTLTDASTTIGTDSHVFQQHGCYATAITASVPTLAKESSATAQVKATVTYTETQIASEPAATFTKAVEKWASTATMAKPTVAVTDGSDWLKATAASGQLSVKSENTTGKVRTGKITVTVKGGSAGTEDVKCEVVVTQAAN